MNLIPFDQVRFFAVLQEELGDKVKVSSWLQQKLGMSKSAAFARIKGHTHLTGSELITIVAHSPTTGQKGTDLYRVHPLKLIQLNQFRNTEEFDRYLRQMDELFQEAMHHSNFSLHYVARDLPVFYFLAHPLLLRYKLSEWTGTPRVQGLPSLSASTLSTAKRLWERYQEMPTTELWNPLCGQRQYLMLQEEEAQGVLHPSEAEELRQVFRSLYAGLDKWTKQRHKSLGGELTLHSNVVFTLNNGGRLRYGKRDILLGAIHNAQHFNSNSPEIISLFEQVWNRHLETARKVCPGSPADQVQFLQQIRGVL